MQITRKQIIPLLQAISTLEKNENFSISTKYKVLKIKEILKRESEFNSTLFYELVNRYGKIEEDGSIFIKPENIMKADQELLEFNNETVLLPDLYFSLEELDESIPWETLEVFLPFIKN